MASPRRPAASRRLLVGVVAVGVLVAGTVVGVSRWRSAAAPASSPTPAVVARVGTTSISGSLFDLRLRSAATAVAQAGGPQPGSSGYGAFVRSLRARVLQSLIVDTVIAQEASFRHLTASDADVDREVAVDAAAAGGMDALRRQLAEAGGSLDQLRDEVRSRIDEQRLEEFFARQRADAIETQLRAGGNFADLARSLSDDDASRASGGDLGTLSPAALQADDPAFAAPVEHLPVGGVTDPPVRDDAGYEILRLDAVTPQGRHLHRILVAAPRPYTVRQRPSWFIQSVFAAIAADCAAGRIVVFVADVGQPCAIPTPGASTPTPRPAASLPAVPGFSPRP